MHIIFGDFARDLIVLYYSYCKFYIEITMKQLEADIKNGIYKKIYVLTGPQSYNRKRYADALVKVFLPEGDTLNLSRFFGKKIDLAEVISLAETMPFLSEKRVIFLENTDLFTHACDELADYIDKIPETCVMIFSEEKIDARLRQSKAVKKSGCIAEFNDLTEKDLRDFVTRRLGKEHRPITQAALDMFIARCGNDLWQVSNELEKVISYTFGKDGIRPEDVEAVIPPLAEDRIFAMMDSILAHDTTTALQYYRDLLLLRSDPRGILGLLRDQYRLILHAKELENEHMKLSDMASLLKMRDTRVKMALPRARKSSKIYLTDAIEKIAALFESINTGNIDEQIGVETLIIELSQKQ